MSTVLARIMLMCLDRPQAKFCLKSDSMSLLIEFFDPILAARFGQEKFDFNRKWSNLIKI